MDSDVSADSLSSPEHGSSAREQGSAFGSMLSFSTQGPPEHASSQRSSSAALDSVDLSPPATDASSGGDGFLDRSSRQQRSSSSMRDAGRLTPLSESRRSSDLLSCEGEDQTADKKFIRYGDNVVVGVAPTLEAAGGRDAIRKRPRNAATDGHPSQERRPSHQHRLNSSWPLFRDQSAGGEETEWEASQPSPARYSSQRGGATTRSPREYRGVPRVSGSSRRMSTGIGDAASFSGFSRGGERFGGETESRGNGSDYGNRGGGIHTNEDDMSVSGSETVRSGGLGESSSIVSEVSSGGLPAPPLIPSGPLPAIGVIREVSYYSCNWTVFCLLASVRD